MNEFRGSLFDCEADIIVQQCNAVTRKSHGLSAEIASRLPYADIYASRSGPSSNTVTSTSLNELGRAVLRAPPKRDARRPIVACLIAQIAPGKPGAWCSYYKIDASTDTAAKRLLLFRQALADLRTQLADHDDVASIAFPDHIGCGLAGGDWSDYMAEIKAFAASLPAGVTIKICKQ